MKITNKVERALRYPPQETKKRCTINMIPKEILNHVFNYLNPKELENVCLLNKRFNLLGREFSKHRSTKELIEFSKKLLAMPFLHPETKQAIVTIVQRTVVPDGTGLVQVNNSISTATIELVKLLKYSSYEELKEIEESIPEHSVGWNKFSQLLRLKKLIFDLYEINKIDEDSTRYECFLDTFSFYIQAGALNVVEEAVKECFSNSTINTFYMKQCLRKISWTLVKEDRIEEAKRIVSRIEQNQDSLLGDFAWKLAKEGSFKMALHFAKDIVCDQGKKEVYVCLLREMLSKGMVDSDPFKEMVEEAKNLSHYARPFFMYDLAASLSHNGFYKQAMAIIKEMDCLSISERDGAHYEISSYLTRSDQVEEAIEIYEKMKLRFFKERSARDISSALKRRGDLESAIMFANKVSDKIYPYKSGIFCEIALSFVKIGMYKRALRISKNVKDKIIKKVVLNQISQEKLQRKEQKKEQQRLSKNKKVAKAFFSKFHHPSLKKFIKLFP